MIKIIKGIVSKTNKPTRDIKKDKGTCHYCGKEGIQRSNCKEYPIIVKKKKFNETSISGMFIIENYLTTLHCSQVLDTEYGFYICNCMQKLKKNKKINLRQNGPISNGARVATLAVGTSYALTVRTSYFVLPNRLMQDNYYFVPVI